MNSNSGSNYHQGVTNATGELPLARERTRVVAAARRLSDEGLVVGTAGNVSVGSGGTPTGGDGHLTAGTNGSVNPLSVGVGGGVAVIGTIQSGAPHLGLTGLSWSTLSDLAPLAAVVALVIVSYPIIPVAQYMRAIANLLMTSVVSWYAYAEDDGSSGRL